MTYVERMAEHIQIITARNSVISDIKSDPELYEPLTFLLLLPDNKQLDWIADALRTFNQYNSGKCDDNVTATTKCLTVKIMSIEMTRREKNGESLQISESDIPDIINRYTSHYAIYLGDREEILAWQPGSYDSGYFWTDEKNLPLVYAHNSKEHLFVFPSYKIASDCAKALSLDNYCIKRISVPDKFKTEGHCFVPGTAIELRDFFL